MSKKTRWVFACRKHEEFGELGWVLDNMPAFDPLGVCVIRFLTLGQRRIMATTRNFKTITRFAITKMGKDGLRTLACANQGRNHFDTEEQAEAMLYAILRNPTNSLETLRHVYGDLSKMQVRPVECYEHGDAVGVYFDD